MIQRKKHDITFIPKHKYFLFFSLLLAGIVLLTASCRDQNIQSSDQNLKSEANDPDKMNPAKSGNESGSMEDTPNVITAMADFSYMPLNILALDDPSYSGYYTIDNDWLYYSRETVTSEEGIFPPEYSISISRGRISDNQQEEDFIVQPKGYSQIILHTLLADGKGNCYVFWGPGGQEKDCTFTLEKYGSSGELIWQTEYNPEELSDMGAALNHGTVTSDGRIFLYNIGVGGQVFSFDPNGSLVAIYTPDLEFLDGTVSGKDGKIYAYCITKGNPIFTELGESEKSYPCPKGILEVYDGRGSNPCVRNGEGMWSYAPESGELERLWGWEDDYIQIAGDDVDAVFRSGESFMVMCSEQQLPNMNKRPVQTFASIVFEDSRKCPPKQGITLATVTSSGTRKLYSNLDLVVRRYNRQSKKYKVEIVEEDSESSIQMKFIQGKCADIIDLTEIYAGNLADIGAFEDLTAYYETSNAVKIEDILEPVREACLLSGKNVLVMPSFNLQTLESLEEEITAKDWDVWKFLERAESEWLVSGQTPTNLLMTCMGVRCGEYFIDYEKKQCSFDSSEFRLLMEACSKAYTNPTNHISFITGDYPLFMLQRIENPWDVTEKYYYGLDLAGTYSDRLVGYPGMNGAEYKLYPGSVFAMNSASAAKEAAWDFLEFTMSEEMQSLIDWGFPSRKDIFDRCLSDIYVSPTRTQTVLAVDSTTNELIMNAYAKEVTEYDLSVLRKIVENAKYDSWGGRLSPIWDIVADEAEIYFNGGSTLDNTIQKIQTRVQLYLNE